MAGIASALTGLGNAAQQYGQQVRPILEQRREGLANLMMQRAQEEPDPTMRDAYYQGALDTRANKDFGKIFPALIKAHQQYVDNTTAMGQHIVDATKQDTTKAATPGPITGIPGGTPLQSLPQDALPPPPAPPGGLTMPENTPFAQLMQQQAAPPAAQPSNNPIDGSAKIQAQPTAAGTVVGQPSVTPATDAIAGLPVPENPADISREIMTRVGPGGTEPLWNAPANRPTLQLELANRLNHQETLRQTQEVLQTQLAYKRAQVDKILKDNPDLPPLFKASLEAEAGGLPGLNIGSALMPHKLSGGTLGSQLPPGSLEYGTNQPVKPDTRYSSYYQAGTGETFYYPETAQTGVAQGANGVPILYNRLSGTPIGPISGAVTGQGGRIIKTGVDPATGRDVYQSGMSLMGASPPNAVARNLGLGINPTFVPRQTTSQRSVSTVDGNGNPVTEIVPVTSTSQRGNANVSGTSALTAIGSGTPPAAKPSALPAGYQPAAPRTFPKGFTPEQTLNNDAKVKQYDIAIGRMQNVVGNLHLLDSMVDSGKLALQMDSSGILKALVNRKMDLTKAEENFVGDMQTLTEDINLIRGPMGATSFRGPEAFAALQAQRGQLLARPNITRRVLQNTLASMQAQRDTIYNAQHPKTNNQAPPANQNVTDPLGIR